MNVYSELVRAQFENRTTNPTPSARTPGRAWWRTDLSELWIDNGVRVTRWPAEYYVNVKDPAYGAVGSDVTKDTAGFLAAYATGKLVFVPAGSYIINDFLPVSGSGAGMIGAGNDAGGTLITYTGSIGGTIIGSNSTTIYSGVLMRDFALTTNAGQTGTHGIDISQWSQGSRLEHLSLQVRGNNAVVIYGKPPTTNFGASPYYTEIDQCDCTAGSIYTGAIGILFDVNRVAGGDNSHQGPNANRIHGGRFFNLDVGVDIRAGQQNVVDAIDCENIFVDAIRLGNPTADETRNAVSATQDTITFAALTYNAVNFYAGGGMSVTTASDSKTRYYEIKSNTATIITLRNGFKIIPAGGDSCSLWAPDAKGNCIRDCRQEGASGANFLTKYPGAELTTLAGTSTVSSIGAGKIINTEILKCTDRLNAERWFDPIPLVFTYVGVTAGLSSQVIYPGGANAPFLHQYQWQVVGITAQMSANITAGDISIWVQDNGTNINVDADLVLNTTNLFNAGGIRTMFQSYAPGKITNVSPGRPLQLAMTTSAGLLPTGTATLTITLLVQLMA